MYNNQPGPGPGPIPGMIGGGPPHQNMAPGSGPQSGPGGPGGHGAPGGPGGSNAKYGVRNPAPNMPQRPSQPDCNFFVKAGYCRFGTNCK